ncbi:MAG: response regulator transcription factor [Pseudomonadota bacterium]
MQQNKIRILIVDDHPLVTDGIEFCLQDYEHIEVVGIGRNGLEALRMAKNLEPDIVLMDINMPELNGLSAIELFQVKLPEIKILILSMHDNRDYITTALTSGARGYILKDIPTTEIVTAIEAIYVGGTYFSAGISDVLLSVDERLQKTEALTSREQTVLLALAGGKSNKQVAQEFDISVRTVETHRKNIKRKLRISSTAGLTRYAIRNGLLHLHSAEE